MVVVSYDILFVLYVDDVFDFLVCGVMFDVSCNKVLILVMFFEFVDCFVVFKINYL